MLKEFTLNGKLSNTQRNMQIQWENEDEAAHTEGKSGKASQKRYWVEF